MSTCVNHKGKFLKYKRNFDDKYLPKGGKTWEHWSLNAIKLPISKIYVLYQYIYIYDYNISIYASCNKYIHLYIYQKVTNCKHYFSNSMMSSFLLFATSERNNEL